MNEQMKNPDAEEVISEIAYLDNDIQGTSPQQDFLEMMKAIAQLEIAKQSHWPNAAAVALRLQSLEAQMEMMKRVTSARRRAYPIPVVQYVTVAHEEPPIIPRRSSSFPKSLIVFYSLGLACSILFAILLALSALGINAIHPFLALLGFIGGIGWLTTAWTDLLSLKAEKSWSHMSETVTLNHHREVLAKTGGR